MQRKQEEKERSKRWNFFLFNHYSHATYLDHGEIMYSPFPVRCPRSGGTLQAPLCPPPRPVPRRNDAHQGNDTRKEKRREKGKKERKNKGDRLAFSSGRNEVGRG